ncbi:MAG: PD-(D/E)XK nuclease family protein [Actinomycetota bacterium]
MSELGRLKVERVRYGRPAAEALRGAIASAKGDDPLRPVTVVVPSNHVGVAVRRLLASGAVGPVSSKGVGIVAVNFLTPYRLAELLGAARLAGSGRRPVSTPVIAAALRAALTENPGLFKPVAAHPATEAALVEAYKELRDISSAALDSLAATRERAAEVVRLHKSARSRLEPNWYDEQDLIDSAVEVLRAGEGPTNDLGPVIVYLPQRLSLHSAGLLSAAATKLGLTVIAGMTGSNKADSEVALSLSRLGATHDPGDLFDPGRVASLETTRFVTASDADDEVRAAVRAVVDAVLAGARLDRIAVLHASAEPYARLIHEHLGAAGIKTNGASVVPLSARVAGRTLLQLLSLPEGGFRRQDVFGWLAGTPVRHQGRWAPVSAWERLSRKAAVVAGRDQWDKLLATHASDLENRAERSDQDPESPPWKAASHRLDAQRTRDLRTFALELIDDLAAAAAAPKKWGEHSRWAHKLLVKILGGESMRRSWPDDERKAAEKVELALDRLGALDEVEEAVSLDVFTRTLALELDNDLGRVGRFGDGVLVGSIGMGVGLDLDLVIVLGLVEGMFPARVRDDSLLPDAERESADGQLPLRRERVGREHRQLLAALSGAKKHLLGVPRGDLRRSTQHVASRWALDIASHLAGERWWSDDLLRTQTDWVDHVPSFSAGVRRVSFPATEQEYRLRFLSSDGKEGPRSRIKAAGDSVLSAGAEVVEARRSDSFTRFDGNVGGLKIPSPAEIITSATRLQRWATCPHDYFLQEVLSVQAVEDPEDELEITPLAKGSLIHEVLERFIQEELDRPRKQQIDFGQPWRPEDKARMHSIALAIFADYEARGQAGRPIFWHRDSGRILADLDKIIDEDSKYRQNHQTRPVAVELAFGFTGSGREAVALQLEDGRAVRFRGLADRLDVGRDGVLYVLDYKTGSTKDYGGLCEQDPDLKGARLQLPVYAAAARSFVDNPTADVVAEFWFVSSKGRFKRVGYHVTAEAMERNSANLATIVAGIESGVFPNYSTEASTSLWVSCDSCDPDALGVVDLKRRWEWKRSDPAVGVFANLVDPPAPGETA